MSAELKPIAEALALTSQDEIRAEIRARLHMREQMVGWLYPTILATEIEHLCARLNELTAAQLREQIAERPRTPARGGETPPSRAALILEYITAEGGDFDGSLDYGRGATGFRPRTKEKEP